MKKISLFQLYSEYAQEFILFNDLKPLEKSLSEQDFNIQLNRTKFVASRFSGEKRSQQGEAGEVEVVLIFCRTELFSKSENYKKIRPALKTKSKAEQEIVIIYENKTKLTNVKSLSESLEESFYVTFISAAAFISLYNNIFTPTTFKILSLKEKEREFSDLYLDPKKLPEIGWCDPMVVFLRARTGDIISSENNSLSSGLHHKYQLVVKK